MHTPTTESARALAAYMLYESMGTERSTAKVAQKCSKNKSLIDRWSGNPLSIAPVRVTPPSPPRPPRVTRRPTVAPLTRLYV